MNRCAAILLAASLLSGCATWDWESAAAYSASPQYQAYSANVIQQSAFDQQLRNQQNYQNSMELLDQHQANIAAQQNLQSQMQADNWQARQNAQTQQQLTNINRRLDAIHYGWYR